MTLDINPPLALNMTHGGTSCSSTCRQSVSSPGEHCFNMFHVSTSASVSVLTRFPFSMLYGGSLPSACMGFQKYWQQASPKQNDYINELVQAAGARSCISREPRNWKIRCTWRPQVTNRNAKWLSGRLSIQTWTYLCLSQLPEGFYRVPSAFKQKPPQLPLLVQLVKRATVKYELLMNYHRPNNTTTTSHCKLEIWNTMQFIHQQRSYLACQRVYPSPSPCPA